MPQVEKRFDLRSEDEIRRDNTRQKVLLSKQSLRSSYVELKDFRFNTNGEEREVNPGKEEMFFMDKDMRSIHCYLVDEETGDRKRLWTQFVAPGMRVTYKDNQGNA